MKKAYVALLLIAFVLMSWKSKPTITGLWVVTNVTVGEDQMTPNARWMRFNEDFTQQSGNGWFQHSVGTWEFDTTNQELKIININGLQDLNPPFKVELKGDEMIWSRIEDGSLIKVYLKRTDKLPTTHGDKLLGLWKLDKAVGNGNFFKASEATNEVLFFKWDKRFMMNLNHGKINGVYNTHGHKSEVELIPYGDQLERSFWKLSFEENTLTLTLLNTDETITRRFIRIHKFPK